MGYRRVGTSSRTARRLRREGKLPAVLYGHETAESIAVDAKKLQDILESETGEQTLIDLFINSTPPERCRVRLRAVQTDSVSLVPLQADFDRVAIDEPTEVVRRKPLKRTPKTAPLESRSHQPGSRPRDGVR